MFPGQYTLCLKTKDLVSMRRYYETLGMKMHFERPGAVLLNNGDIDLALMTFLDQTCLNFRGADPFEIHKQAIESGLKTESQPQRYKKEQYDNEFDGMNWIVHDPGGNKIFFDTNEGELGEAGAALSLQRVLDSTAKQLINIGASAECRETFHNQVLDKFMPPERRAKTAFNLDTSPLTEPGMFAGYFTYCLKTTNNQLSREFYETLGIKVAGNNDENWVQVDTSDCHMDLMTFLGGNWLNFRGGDVFEIYDRLKAADFDPEGKPVTYTAEEMSAAGAHWNTKDPDGNVVYFDTTDAELIVQGAPRELRKLFDRTLRQLADIDAIVCIDVFNKVIVEKYLSSETEKRT